MSDPAPAADRRTLGELAALAALLLVYALVLRAYFVPALGSPDANCYHVSAKLLAETGELSQRTEDPVAYVGHLWLRSETGDFYPKYPPLYPALAALAQRLFGHPAGLYINPIAAWLAVLFTYVAARSFLPGWAAVLSAGSLAVSPVFNAMAVDQIAHAPSVAALTMSFALLFRAGKRPLGAGSANLIPFAASGLLLGFACGVRYTNVLLAIPVATWFALRMREDPKSLPRALSFAVAFALPCMGLAWYHWSAFGSPLRTAYALTNEQSAFSLDFVGRNLRLYVPALFTTAIGPLFALSLMGFGLVTGRRNLALFYTAWIAPLALLYLTYYYAPEHHPISYVRFLLPIQLPLILLGMTALVSLTQGITDRKRRVGMIAGLALLQAVWGVHNSVQELELRYSFNDMVRRRIDFVTEQIPAGSMIFATRWLLDDLDYHIDRTVDGRHLYENDLVDQAWLTRVTGQFLEKESIQRDRVEGVQAVLVNVPYEQYQREVAARIDAALAAGRGVFVVGTDQVHGSFDANFKERYDSSETAVLKALEPHHRLRTLEREGDLSQNPAWGQSSIRRIEARP